MTPEPPSISTDSVPDRAQGGEGGGEIDAAPVVGDDDDLDATTAELDRGGGDRSDRS